MSKLRLDLVVQTKMQISRNRAVQLIKQGLVTVEGVVVTKPSTLIMDEKLVHCVVDDLKYVSRAGLKLEAALTHFKLDVAGMVVLDAGLSTGGFADCLLQHGVSKIYGVDVGTSQVHAKIAQDLRVVVMEQTNLRYLKNLPEQVDLITLDVSFISVLKVIENAASFLKPGGTLLVLIKPQFEFLDQVNLGKKLNDLVQVIELAEQVAHKIAALGFKHQGLQQVPLLGSDGNQEFFALFTK